ncbi:hypothetical protein NCC78_31855, partial [Micromonospora phytophila]|uniref:hypothetical protein n=1 Tax=Micromonospora phytophila TaxID=709888 RepID=UPI00202E9630
MADSQNAPARTRPGVVTVSTYLLILFAIIQLITLIVSLSTVGKLREALDDLYRGTSANGTQNVADFAIAATIGGGILALLLAVALAVLGLFNNRGSNGSRIATWILGGILVCCTGGSLLSGLAGGLGGPTGTTGGDGPTPQEVQRRLDEALPSWVGPVTTLLGVVALLSLLAALILLALPKANEFFRKPKPQWEPPVPGASYPGYPQAGGGQPGYPQAPGYPQPPGQPGYPAPGGQPPSAP